MRCLLFVLLLLSGLARGEALLTNTSHRQSVSLNGAWASIIDPYETGYFNYRHEPYDQEQPPSLSAFFMNHHARDKTELVEYDFDQSATLNVPGDWNTQRESLFYYEGTVWFKRSFDDTRGDPQHRLFVYFGAVNYQAEVYLNGHKLGRHEGGFTPFNFEVTSLLRPKANFLVVKVDNRRLIEAVPTVNTDWWNYGGITREVLLIEEPKSFIQDYQIQLKKNSPQTIAGFVQLQGAADGEAVQIEIAELGLVQSLTTHQGYAAFEMASSKIQYWSPESPKLYQVVVATGQQRLRDEIGLRSISTDGPNILLNGKSIYLRGISIHEENPLRGARAFSEADALQALTWAKELGCNYVRLAHYPHNEHMLRLADKLGLLVWEEIPVYWTVDFANAATLKNAKQQLTEAISRDRNRAAVIVWSMANETPPSNARNVFLSRLMEQARALDSTRLLSAALQHHAKDGDAMTQVLDDSIGEKLDIVGVNEYIGWYGGTPQDAARSKWQTPFNKPLVVSEFGAGAVAARHGSRDQRWTEEYQEYLYQQTLLMLESMPNLRGVSPWILADFRSPKRLLPGVQDGWNRKGLISNTGLKKKAFFTLREFYDKKALEYR
ncbi:MAG: glycoside hydrolase family 2 TIM barrel-domain containing protein [Betaproteobacteria bacterium]